jgi:Carboxypeptidase regulatory-like domain
VSGIIFFLALFQAAVGNGVIQGVVVNNANEGIFRARVELTGGSQGPATARTDGQGRFVFTNLSPGVYRLTVKKDEYLRQEYGQKNTGGTGLPIVIEAGTQLQGLVFRMQPASTIAGAVKNETGVPVANILIQALRRSYGVRGNRTITVFSNALTDDLGGYRLYWIDPGDYYVNASYLPQLPTPVNPNDSAPRTAYAPTYYPGFLDSADAKEVRLEGGKVLVGIDFRLERATACKVTGSVRSALNKTTVPATVTLNSLEQSGSTARYSITTNDKGFFEMKAVNPGSYVLIATADDQMGISPIKTTCPKDNPDYENAVRDILIGPGVTTTIRLFGDVPPAADLHAAKFSLVPVETYMPTPQPSLVDASGALVIQNVQPGEYLLSASGLPDTAYVKASRMDQRDVLEQFAQVQYDMRPPLDIQLAFDGGQMSGTVADAANKPVDRATVILIPEKARRHRPDQYRVVVSTTDGKFSIGGIPPGEYKIFAWDTIEPNAWLNSDFMLNHEELGLTISVMPGEKLTAQLRVIP